MLNHNLISSNTPPPGNGLNNHDSGNCREKNGWVHDAKGRLARNGTPVMVINRNPNGRPAHWKMVNGEAVSQVQLPVSFDEVRLGTTEQRIAPWQSGW